MRAFPLVLASTSPYRRALVERLGLAPEIEAPGVDESVPGPPGEAPADRAVRLAIAKARAVHERRPGALVIGSDQVVDLDGEVLGKPGDAAGARAQLARLTGRRHRLVTALAVVHPDGRLETALDVHEMTMRPLDAAAIGRYVDRDAPLDCAGSYRIESLGIALFELIEGRDFTAIVGLPLIALSSILGSAGLHVP